MSEITILQGLSKINRNILEFVKEYILVSLNNFALSVSNQCIGVQFNNDK